jgi:membrane fusion protein (multidrug efflux system)
MAEPGTPKPFVARKVLRAVLLVVAALAAAAAALYFYAAGGRNVETDNAYVKSHIIVVSAEVPGRVAAVEVRDNQAVAAGAPLFRIDPAPFEVAIAKADAQMAVVRTDLASLRAEYRVALAEAREAEERIDFTTRQLERQRQLKERGMGREDTFDEARHNLDVARASARSEARARRARRRSEPAARAPSALSGGAGRAQRSAARSRAHPRDRPGRRRREQHAAAGG